MDDLTINHNSGISKMKKSRSYPSRRKFSLRTDSSVGSGQKIIESVFGLPKGSVKLHLPSGRKSRTDKSIASLLKDWGW